MITLPFSIHHYFQEFYPHLIVTIRGPRGPVSTKARFDTGAEWSLFHASVASVTGIDIEKGTKLFIDTRWGHLTTYVLPIKLEIEGENGSIEFYSKAAFDTGVTGGFQAETQHLGFIGQRNFLDRISVCLHYQEEIFLNVREADPNIISMNISQ